VKKLVALFFTVALGASAFANSALAQAKLTQTKQVRTERRPPMLPDPAESQSTPPKPPSYEYFSILNGLPMLFELHHDTEVGTNRPVDVYVFVIELQVMNSDGDAEPIGLDIFNFFTAKPQNPDTAPNPHNPKDCRTWNKLINQEIATRNQSSATWPYVEFTVAQGARRLQTNEDGQVFWSDDVECWGSQDRFPPF
jgi:hypothetical protein